MKIYSVIFSLRRKKHEKLKHTSISHLSLWNLFIYLFCILVPTLADTVVLHPSQERLDQLAKDNEQLKTEVQELLNSSSLNTSLRDQGTSKIHVRKHFAYNSIKSLNGSLVFVKVTEWKAIPYKKPSRNQPSPSQRTLRAERKW